MLEHNKWLVVFYKKCLTYEVNFKMVNTIYLLYDECVCCLKIQIEANTCKSDKSFTSSDLLDIEATPKCSLLLNLLNLMGFSGVRSGGNCFLLLLHYALEFLQRCQNPQSDRTESNKM